jgi:hypothetical protein
MRPLLRILLVAIPPLLAQSCVAVRVAAVPFRFAAHQVKSGIEKSSERRAEKRREKEAEEKAAPPTHIEQPNLPAPAAPDTPPLPPVPLPPPEAPAN